MSIVASVKVYDGIVLGSDSKTQLRGFDQHGQRTYIQTFNHARKLFQIRELPIGILTYGAGNIGRRSVESHIIEFTRNLVLTDDLTVRAITDQLLKHLKEVFDDQYQGMEIRKRPALGIFVAGYSGVPSSLPDEWEFNIPRDDKARKVRPSDEFGASWRGISIPFTRLYTGIDPRIIAKLKTSGLSNDIIETLTKAAQEWKSSFVFDGMPIIDAAEFCRFILRTTINMAKFETGVDSCGGPLDIAVITRSKGFEWVEQKKLTAYGEKEV